MPPTNKEVEKYAYCLLHHKWLKPNKVYSKCLNSKKQKQIFCKCKHLILIKEEARK